MLFSSRRTVVKRPYGRIPGPVPAALSTLGYPSIQDPCRRQRRRLKRGGGTVSLMTGGSLALSGGGPRGRAAKSSPAAHPLPCLRRTVTSASVLDPCCPTVAGPWSSPVAPHALRRARPRRHGRMLWACIAANPRHAAGELSWPLCLRSLLIFLYISRWTICY